MKFFIRDNRELLKESLETIVYISKDEFLSLLRRYNYYCYDPRCNQLLWILKDIPKNFKEYKVWLGIEL